MMNADNENFELVLVDDIPAIFTSARLNRESIPKGVFCYDIRHDDGQQGIACEIAPHVLANHWGTIITRQEIPLEHNSYYPENDINYLGYEMTLGEFMQADIGSIVETEWSGIRQPDSPQL